METQIFTTPSGKQCEMVTRLPAHVIRDVTRIDSRFLQIKMENELIGGKLTPTPKVTGFDGSASQNAKDDLLIKSAVVSFDNSADNIVGRILEGDWADYEEIVARANALINPPASAPSGKQCEMVTRLPAHVIRDVTRIDSRFLQIKMENELIGGKLTPTPKVTGFDGSASQNAKDDLLIKSAVVSFDNSADNIVGRILEGDWADYEEIVARANALINPPASAK